MQHAWNNTVAAPSLSKPLQDVDMMFTSLGHHWLIVCHRGPADLGALLHFFVALCVDLTDLFIVGVFSQF